MKYLTSFCDDVYDYPYDYHTTLFEATCCFYEMLDDVGENEWVVIYDEDDKTVKSS